MYLMVCSELETNQDLIDLASHLALKLVFYSPDFW